LRLTRARVAVDRDQLERVTENEMGSSLDTAMREAGCRNRDAYIGKSVPVPERYLQDKEREKKDETNPDDGLTGDGYKRVSVSATAMAKNNTPTLESQGDVPARLRRNEKCHQGTYPVVPLGGLAGGGLMTPFGGAPRASLADGWAKASSSGDEEGRKFWKARPIATRQAEQ
jgi:hypothetical protein